MSEEEESVAIWSEHSSARSNTQNNKLKRNVTFIVESEILIENVFFLLRNVKKKKVTRQQENDENLKRKS